MKKGVLKIMLIGGLLMICQATIANDFYTKKYHKEFKANPNTLLQIQNRYGDLHIENWDKNIVMIDVVIEVKASSKLRADKTFEKININFHSENDLISAITEITETIRNTKFNINYTVKMPKKINVDLSNKYGNLFLEEVQGHANINVKYGSFTINKLTRGNQKPLNYLYVAYSGGICDIDQANWLKMEIKYSKVSVNQAEALMIDSKYSSLAIKKSKSVVSESKYDHPFKIGAVKNFICTGAYTSFDINKLYNKLDIEGKYCNIAIDEVKEQFESIKITLRYGKAYINIPKGISYQLKADAAYGSIHYPETESKHMNKIIDGTDSSIWGIVGNKSDAKGKVIIDSKYGSVHIKQE